MSGGEPSSRRALWTSAASTSARRGGLPLSGGELNAAITSAVVGIHTHYLGRGPRTATTFHRDDTVVTVLTGVLTRAERVLVAEGQADAVAHMRHLCQQAMEREFVAAVERLTGARVTGFVSGNSPDHDIATEIFILDRGLRSPAAQAPRR